MRGTIAIVIACVGCTSVHTSRLPPYVRELVVAPDRIDMVQCVITYKKETTHTVIAGSSTEHDVDDGPCWRTTIPTVVAEGPMTQPVQPMQMGQPPPMTPSPSTPTRPAPAGGRR